MLSTVRDCVLTLAFCFKRYSHSRQRVNKYGKEHKLSHGTESHIERLAKPCKHSRGLVAPTSSWPSCIPWRANAQPAYSLSLILRLSWTPEDIIGPRILPC